MFEPALVALTSTPSIATSSAELTTPVSATGACAEAVDENAAARARPKAKLAAAKSGWCMGFLPAFFYFHQHKLTRLRGASLPSSARSEQRGDDGKIELLRTVAAELVALKADVIVARRELA